jgi:hypothetical protein
LASAATCLADTAGLGRGVHRQEHHVDGSVGAIHHGIQARFIDRQLAEDVVISGRNPLGVEIHHRSLDVRATISDNRHRGPTHIAGADAADGLNRGVDRPGVSDGKW